ncbi:hypothetical protein LNTAR_03729 [Lentisphaera araneosa HTCC2155]|uniref:Lipoprotein n=1 Tax=Lentisphaera araneosa HTCC2155 TaxID=313628 RepID=A6DTM7_9BACT|nr:hypothetical protein [Lentisphaera araneosa]EDM25007.1 hypothetical protein LNTAR_03729 [Lentisphaera araneosa HTCC2155]
MIFRIINYILLSLILFSCASNNEPSELEEIEKADDVKIEEKAELAEKAEKSVLGSVLENPDVYLNQTLSLKGMLDAVEFKKLGKHSHLVSFKFIPEERIDEWAQIRYDAEKYTFITRLQEADKGFTSHKDVDLYIRPEASKKMVNMAHDFKAASQEIKAMGYVLSGLGKDSLSSGVDQIAKAFEQLGDAFFALEAAAKKGNEEDLKDEKVQKKCEEFEEALLSGGRILLRLSKQLQTSQILLTKGLHSFDYENRLSLKKSYAILTQASMIRAHAWYRRQEGKTTQADMSLALAEALTLVGQGNKTLHLGFKELAVELDKTAVNYALKVGPALQCAYLGYNRSHLERCSKKLQQVPGNIPVTITGTLLKSNLREQVGVLWLKLNSFEVDGFGMLFPFDDKSSSEIKASDLYEWMEGVKE